MSNSTAFFTLPLALVGFTFLPACTGSTDDSDSGAVADTDTDTDTDTDADTDADTDTDTDTDTDAPLVYDISGTAVDFPASTPVAEGLCVVAVDPGPALAGGEATPLGNTTVGVDGTFTMRGLQVKPTLGLVVIVQDCAAEGTVYPTGTGISSATLEEIQPGGMLADRTIFSIGSTFKDGMVGGVAVAGSAWSPDTQGIVVGFVLDATGAPVGGATVTGAAATTYYMDTDSSDGLFSVAGATNSSTAAGVGVFAIPAAPVTTYTAAADSLTFDTVDGWSIPGLALYVAFSGT